jgi:translocation and assembly module TamB
MRRLRKVLLWTVAILFLPVLLVIGVGIAFVYLAGEESWTAALRQATSAASSPELAITVDRLHRDDKGVVRLSRASLSDPKGTWLVIDDVAVDIHPSQLLSGILHLETLTVGRIEVLRQPQPGEEPDQPEVPFAFPDRIALPELPLSLELRKLRLGEIILAEGVAPETSRLTAAGHATAAPDRISVELDVKPLDLGDSRLVAHLSIDPASGRLDALIDASLPTIEPLRSALAAPEDSHVSLNVAGGGPLNDARLDIGLNIGGVLDLVGELKVAIAPDAGMQLDLAGFASLIGGNLALPASIIGPSVEFSAAAAVPTPDQLALESLVLDAQFLTLSADGRVNLSDEKVSLKAKAAFRNHAGLDELLQGAAFEIANLSATVEGSLNAPQADLGLTLEAPGFGEFQARSVNVHTIATAEGAGATGTVRITLTAPAATDADIAALLGPLVGLETSFQADPAEVRLQNLTLTSAFARMTGDLALDPARSTISGEIMINADSLSLAPQLADMLTEGRASIGITLDQAGAETGDASVEVRLDQLKWRDPALQALTGDAVSVETNAALSGVGVTTDLNITTASGMTGQVKGAGTENAIEADYRLSVPRIPGTLVPPEIEGLGNLVLAGKLAGTPDNPSVRGRLSAGDLSVNGELIAKPLVDFTARNLAAQPAIDLSASARIMEAPLKFASSLTADLATNTLGISDLKLDWNAIQASATGTVDLTTQLAEISATIIADDLSQLGDLAGQPLTGALEARLETLTSGTRMNANLTAAGTAFAASDASIESLELTLNVQDVLAAAPGLAGTIEATNITTGDAIISLAKVNISGDLQRPLANMLVRSTAPAAVELTTTIRADLADPEALGATFEALQLAAEQGIITARQPFTITALGDTIELAKLDLTSSIGGQVTGNATYTPDRLAAILDIRQLPVGGLATIAGMEGFKGEANATLRLDTAQPSDKAALAIRVSDLTVPDIPSDTPFTVTMDGAWRDDLVVGEARISGPFDRPMVAKVSGQLRSVAGQPLPTPPPDGKIEGSVTWQGDLARLLALLPESDHLADGAASVDIALGGTWSEPAMRGNVAIADARYENQLTGTHLSQLGLNVRFNDAGAGQFSLSGSGPEGGTISGEGEVVLIGPDKHADIHIALRNLLAMRRDEIRAIVGGDTRLTWDGKRVNVHVRKVLERVDVFLAAPDLPPSVVAIELERDRSRAAEQEEKAAPDLPIDLDIQVSSPGQFFVRGRGLESEWRGDLIVTGTAGDPVIRSKFEAVRGSLALLGRDFRLDKGELGLDESFKPTFRVELLRETPDVTGRIIVSGSPAKPDIAFSSEPELPPDEVLPRILFDKAKQSLSPLEAVNLAQGIRTLTNGKPGTTDRIREAVGLDVLRFEEGEDADSAGAVSVGRYVRDGVYVGAKKSVDSEAGSVVVEIDLLPNVKVDAEVGQGGGGSTGITWEKKY